MFDQSIPSRNRELTPLKHQTLHMNELDGILSGMIGILKVTRVEDNLD